MGVVDDAVLGERTHARPQRVRGLGSGHGREPRPLAASLNLAQRAAPPWLVVFDVPLAAVPR